MLDAGDRQVMLEAVGVEATLESGTVILVAPPEYTTQRVLEVSGEIITVPPVLLAASEDVESNNIQAGENGDIITIDNRDWRILSIKPSSGGFVDLELGSA